MRFSKWLCIAFILIISGCSRFPLPNEHDPYGQKTRADYEKMLTQQKTLARALVQQRMPAAKPRIEEPKLPSAFYKKINVRISKSVPLNEVIPEIVKEVGVDLEMATLPNQGVQFSAKNITFIDFIDRITHLLKWRYTVQGNCLRLEPDTPFLKNYNVQFLSLRRESKNNVSVATKLLNTDAGVSLNNGSDSSIQSSMTNDFWAELENSLKIILLEDASKSPQKPFAMHKQAGILSIYATQAKHKVIDKYLKKLRKIASAQVLIEAKVVEVTLKNEYKSGINWSALASMTSGIQGTIKNLYGGAQNASEGLILKAEKDQMSGILNLMDKFGTTRTLSSPRLTVMNNQPAILKVVENQVYFNVRYDTYYTHTKNNNADSEPFTNIQSQIQTVPIGLILTVQPSIDLETGEIIMALRPTISSSSGYVLDPAVELAAQKYGQAIQSKIPVIKIDEINSVLRLGKEMVILGGMMQEVVQNNQNGFPGVADTPVSGFFSNKQDTRKVKELVIFLRAVHLNNNETGVEPADKSLLQNFITDPRARH